MKKKQKEKRVAMALATSLIVGSLPANLVYAETDIIDKLNSELEVNVNENTLANNNIEKDNKAIVEEITAKEFTRVKVEVMRITLEDGRVIRAAKDENNEVTLQELDATSQWIDKVIMGQVEVKEMAPTKDGGYTVTYLDHKKNDSFKYKQAYDKNYSKIGTEEIVGIEIITVDSNTLSLDLVVNNNSTTIKTPLGESIVKDFTPVFCDYIGSEHIFIIGEDSQGDSSALVVTGSGKVVNGDAIKNLQGVSPEYTEIKSLGASEIEDEKFIISGYAVKGTEPGKKDGFLIQFDENGNKDSEIKIISSSYSKNGDASINLSLKFASGNILIKGDNLSDMYVNSLDYVDTRPIKESLTLSNGKSYKVVKETTKSKAGSGNVNTFAVKSINDIFEYDIATYQGVEDVKLIPGNKNQVLIAVSNMDNSTEVGVINTEYDADVDNDGEVISKVVDAGKIEDSKGPILNIDIKNIKVNGDGKLSVTTINSSTPIEVDVKNVEAGTPIDVIKPQPPVEEEPEVKPEEKPEVNPEEKPEEKPEGKPEATPPTENNQIVNIDKGEEIVFDITKPTNIKIVSSKLENKDVEYILVNGIKVTKTTIEGKLTRSISAYATKEYFSVDNGSIILSAELFEDLNLDTKEGYSIGVGFTDGSQITELAKLSIVDSSVDTENTVTSPVEEDENDSDNGNNSNSGSDSTTNEVETNDEEQTNNTEDNTLPKTGSSIGSGAVSAFGMLSALVGTVLLKKNK